MIQVNNEWVYEDLNEKNIVELVETFRRGETPATGPQIARNRCEGPLGRSSLEKSFSTEQKFDRDFSAAKKNPYAAQLKKQITIRLDEESLAYFKAISQGAVGE